MAPQPTFLPDISDVRKIAIKFGGNIKEMAEHFNVARDTMYQYMYRNAEGKKVIDEVMQYNLSNYKKNPGLAQRASEKVIDKKGHLRGWGVPPVENVATNQSELDKDDIIMRQQAEIAQLKKKAKLNDSE